MLLKDGGSQEQGINVHDIDLLACIYIGIKS